MSPTKEEIKERKTEFRSALKERLTPNLRIIFGAFDFIMVGTVLVDLAFLANLIGDTYLQPLVVVNLVTVVIGYVSYATKKRLSRQISKELFGDQMKSPSEGDEEEPEVKEEAPSEL